MPIPPGRVVAAAAAVVVAVAVVLSLLARDDRSAACCAPIDPDRTVVVAFMPAEFLATPGIPLLDSLAARRELAIGLTSPSLGFYSRQQTLLDISAGSRISSRTYPELLAPLFLRARNGLGRIDGWNAVRDRARDAPGEIVPGLLASTVTAAGGRASYVGARGLLQGEAIVATNREGGVAGVSLGSEGTIARRVVDRMDAGGLISTRLPRGERGLEALDLILAARDSGDIVYVMRAPPFEFGLLATAVAADGYSGVLRSATTRRDGLVTATDIAPTALEFLGVGSPPEIQGQPVTSTGAGDPATELLALEDRQESVTTRRIPALLWTAAGWLSLMLLAGAFARGRGLRFGLRVGLLTLIWLPSLALLTSWIDPSLTVELAVLAAGSLCLGVLSDRLLGWPGAPLVPAAVLVLAHTADLVAGSPLIVGSVAGPTPRGGARFYGVGNELETILIVGTLIGTAAAVAGKRATRAPLVYALVATATAVILGAGRLGADVGGVITVGAGGAVAVLAAFPARPSRKAVVLAILAPLIALVALAAIDLATGGGAHFTRSVIEADSPDALLDTATRRLDLAYAVLVSGTTPYSVAAFAVVIAAGLWKRRGLLAPLAQAVGPAAARAYAAGVYGAVAAIVFGSVANDSGARIFLIGAVPVILAGTYAWAAPGRRDRAAKCLEAGAPGTISRCA